MFSIHMHCFGTPHVDFLKGEHSSTLSKKLREKSRECANHKQQPILDTKRKTKLTKANKCKSNKRTKALRLLSEVIAMLKGQKNIRTK